MQDINPELETQTNFILDITGVGWWDWHIDTGKMIWNKNQYRLLGLSPDNTQPSYQTWRDRVYPDDVEGVESQIQSALSNNSDCEIEYRVTHPDGSLHWLMARGRGIYDSMDRAVRMVGIQLDITNKKQVEADLHRRKQEFKAVVEHTPDVITRHDRLFRYIYVNPALVKESGLTPDFYLGKTPEELGFCPKMILDWKPPLQKAFTTGKTDLHEYNLSIPGKKTRWYQSYIVPEFGDDGTVESVLTISRDITQIKEAEAALRRSETEFRVLCEASPVGIIRVNAQLQCIYTNPRAQAIAGYTSEEALGLGWKQFIHPDDLDSFTYNWMQSIAVRQEFFGEVRCLHKNGSIRFCQVRTAPIFSDEGKTIGYVGTIEDTTEIRTVEKIKSEFISVVSHELRTPLASIRGSLGLLASGKLDNQPQRSRRMLEIAATDTERLVRLVNDILDLERLESGKMVMVKQDCDVANLIQRSVDAIQPIAEEADIKIAINPISALVYADPDRIIQALVNLLGNAVKFSQRHSTVILSAERRLGTGEVLLQVKDSGRGIPTDKLEIIFGKFQQADASDSRNKGGTGLGLAISRNIVQSHGGEIWVESALGEGSTFYFTLPLAGESKMNE